MSSWPDDGALVLRWKKANEARCTKFSLMIDEKIIFPKLRYLDSLFIWWKFEDEHAHITCTHRCVSAI